MSPNRPPSVRAALSPSSADSHDHGHSDTYSPGTFSPRRLNGDRTSPGTAAWRHGFAISISRFDSKARSAIAGAVGHLPSKVRPRHAHRIKHGLELEKEVVWMWKSMLIGLGVFFIFLVGITLGLIYAVGFASKNSVVEGGTLVSRTSKAPVQLGNSAFTVDSRNMLVTVTPGSNTTAPRLVQTTTAQTLKLLSSNMTAAELQSVRRVYLKSGDGTELALKVSSFTMREDMPASGGRGVRVALLRTPSGTLQLRGESVSVLPGAGGVLLQQDGNPLFGLASVFGML